MSNDRSNLFAHPQLSKKGEAYTHIPTDLGVCDYFNEQLCKYEQLPAIINNDETVSFETLDTRSTHLAHALLDTGAKKNDKIGVLVNRSARLPQAILAIYKMGGIYVPLVSDHPVERLDYMLDLAEIEHVIALDGLELPDELSTSPSLLRPEAFDTVAPQKRPLPKITIDAERDIASVLFTSGSTGRPKGVELSHRALTNMIFGHISAQKITHHDRILLSSSPGFILGFREAHLTFFTGACHIAVDREQLNNPKEVIQVMEKNSVSVALFTPSYLRLFDGYVPNGLKTLITAGERPNLDDARHYAKSVNYWNCHGSTETCGTYCMHQVSPVQQAPLPSGKKFPNTKVILLDEDGNEVPDGHEGEIYVVGLGLARGYLKRPELTAESFVDTTWGRAYRTKDYGRWNENGELIALGRIDDVVKIDGQAVTLSEIEKTLSQHDQVNHAVAIMVDNRLNAVVETSLSPSPTPDYWRHFLGRSLPAYMIPSHIACIDKFPVSSAGKADRLKLIEIARTDFNNREIGAIPETSNEKLVAQAWQDVLKITNISVEDNFFALGGTSLNAIEVSLKLQTKGYDLPTPNILAYPVLKNQATLLREHLKIDIENQKTGLASSVQQDFWTAWKLGRAQSSSLVTRILEVNGPRPTDAKWQNAWEELTKRHSSFKTEFYEDGAEKLQWRINEHASPDFTISKVDSLEEARTLIKEFSERPIALDIAPLVSAGLVHVTDHHKTLFWFVLHHSVIDGLSAQTVQNELFSLLNNEDLKPAGNGQALACQIETNYIESIDLEKDRLFWQQTLERAVQSPSQDAFEDYALDKNRPLSPSNKPSKPLYEHLNAEEVQNLEQLARLHGVSLHSLLMGLLAHETRRRTNKQTVIIGTGISNQPTDERSTLGLFVNLVPTVLEKISSNNPIFEEFQQVQSHMGGIGTHARLPLSHIIQDFRARHPDERTDRTTLFDLSFTANPSRFNQDETSGFALKPWRSEQDRLLPAAGLELAFHHELLSDGSLELGLVWNNDVYYKETALQWLKGFSGWARYLAQDISRANTALPNLLPEEVKQLSKWENGPKITRPKKRFDQLCSDLARHAPEQLAVISETKTYTRADLDEQANIVANNLLKQGVQAGDVVAVLSGVNMSLPAVILGIWKTGGIYLPLALDIPTERQSYISQDASADILIAVDTVEVPQNLQDQFKTVLRLEDMEQNISPVDVETSHNATAFIIYTSGTTGRPKGVLCTHEGMINAIFITDEEIHFNEQDRVAMVASAGFDASLWELGMGLLLGGGIVPISHELRDDPWEMKKYYQKFDVRIAFHAPSYIRISRDTPFNSLRVLITGGEAPSHEDFKAHGHELTFINAYGPSETTIIVCLKEIPEDFNKERPLPVGGPSANECFSIRRNDGSLVPIGSVGEVWLGGMGVGQGYLNNPELTDQRFVKTDQGTFYRSGDLGRWTADGELELAGRVDHQVKLHGQRLELEEIEQALQSLDTVKEAVVLLHEGANETKTLQGFIRLNDKNQRLEHNWRDQLGQYLAPYMIPANLTIVDQIPVNQSGKLDRTALLSLIKNKQSDQERTAPKAGLESQVAEIWQDLLSTEIHREDNFFALGGNSLLAVSIAHRLSKHLNKKIAARDLFGAPTLSGFTQKIENCAPLDRNAHERSDIATESEREFWTAEQAGLDTRTFIILVQQEIFGEVPSAKIWDDAWAKVVERHGALRTFYREDTEGTLRRRLGTNPSAKLSHSTVATREEMRLMLRKWQSIPLKMAQSPLWRGGVITEQENNTSTFWLAIHHAIGDGRSVGILLKDLAAFLDAQELPSLQSDLDESGAAYNAYLEGEEAQADRKYWDNILTPVPDHAFDEWALDYSREDTPHIGTHRLRTYLSKDVADGVSNIASTHNASLHALMLTLLAFETKRRSGRDEFILGTTASSRETAEDNELVGCFVNMLPLPYKIDGHIAFNDLLIQTQTALMGALQHERFPFAHIYHDVWDKRPHLRSPLRFPLFDFVVTENPAPETIGGVFNRPAVVGTQLSYEFTDWPPGQDLVLMHERQPDGSLMLEWHVNAEVYNRTTSENWFEALVSWVKWLGEDTNRAKSKLPALLPQEQQQLIKWEKGPVRPRPDCCVYNLFEKHAERTPDAPAIVTIDGTITYDKLDKQANQIANKLLTCDLKTGDVVAVLTQRSPHLASAMFGIWKAGGVYLPLAADLPEERLNTMAQDAKATHLIVLDGNSVTPKLAETIPHIIRPEDLSPRTPDSKPAIIEKCDDAYILFTSGSTGRPKGTRVGHRAYLNMIQSIIEEFEVTPNDRTLMFSSPSFDVSLSDVGVPLASGASLCPLTQEQLDSPNKVLKLIDRFKISIVDITPTYLRLFDKAPLPSVRILVTGGEAPFTQDVAHYAGQLKYYNAYGPTENTITSSHGLLTAQNTTTFTCGKPLANTSIEVRNDQGARVPIGVTGEIWLGGDNLANGYLNRDKETREAFIQTPEGMRYKTGDLGRWSSDGQLEIQGRRDEQVKLNGIRVEISEIENAIEHHENVAQCCVVVERNETRSHKLYGFVRLNDPQQKFCADYINTKLPAYMVPTSITVVENIPTNHSGKVDKKALLNHIPHDEVHQGLSEPSEELECLVAQVWQKHLNCKKVYLENDFFKLGGHSLLAIAVANDLEKQLNYTIAARELFTVPTLAGFVERVRAAANDQSINAKTSSLATQGQKEFWIIEKAGLDTRGFNLALTLHAQGATPPPIKWAEAWKQVVQRHSILQTQFKENEQGELHLHPIKAPKFHFEHQLATDLAEAKEIASLSQTKPISMADGPLWRSGLIQLGDDTCIFWLSLHHAIADGWSLGVITQELEDILRGSPAKAIENLYEVNAAQENDYLNSKACIEDKKYWQKTLSSMEGAQTNDQHPFDEWPLDYPRQSRSSTDISKGSHCLRTRLSAETVKGLQELAQENSASLHAVMLSLMSQEIHRRTRRKSFLLGTVTSRRESAAQADSIGYFINMLPVDCHLDTNQSLNEAIQKTQSSLAKGLKHQRYPFAQICKDASETITQSRHPARMPLFDFAVTENPAIELQSQPHDWTFNPIQNDLETEIDYEQRRAGPPQDMVLIHEARQDGSRDLILFANANIYKKETAQNWLESLQYWATSLGEKHIQSSQNLPALTKKESDILNRFHGIRKQWPTKTFVEIFQRSVDLYRNRPALISEKTRLTYDTLDRLSDALAKEIVAKGIQRGDRVAVLCERSRNLPLTALAIWKSGGVYLPLTTSLPEDRMAYMCADANPRLLIVLDDHKVPSKLLHLPSLCPQNLSISADTELPNVHPDDPAYILYTSGSTGTPKGVEILHKGLNNLAFALGYSMDMDEHTRLMLSASPSFDAWISDLVMTWAAGGAVLPITREEMNDIEGVKGIIEHHEINHLTFPPSYLRLFNQAPFKNVRSIMTGGEPPLANDVAFYADRLNYYNGYGPTENTVATSVGLLLPTDTVLHAGPPIPNVDTYILNEEGDMVPPYTTGRLWVGGIGLGHGYLNLPNKTKAAYKETKFGRLYDTGDLAKWDEDGKLVIQGRVDSQVKLRGQRVELGEIEARLEEWPDVKQAVALIQKSETGIQTLWAFVTLTHSSLQRPQSEWQDFLSEKLPSYMIPASVIAVETIPTGLAGKIDQKALLEHVKDLETFDTDFDGVNKTPPAGETEIRIAEIWSKQFGNRKIAREDNFFELGGDSLRVIAVINELRREYDCNINDLYENAVLADFAKHCQHRPEHIETALKSAKQSWLSYMESFTAFEEERNQALEPEISDYQTLNQSYNDLCLADKQSYQTILLTGATGYLGAYLLRELMDSGVKKITVLVRAQSHEHASARIKETLSHYFGDILSHQLCQSNKLNILAADLRQDDFALSTQDFDALSDQLDAIYHCAANVNHFGHYHELYADNVLATQRLIDIAASVKQKPADFHHVSTISVAGSSPKDSFKLFSEYSDLPETLSDNYYIRTKQEAERCVIEARKRLSNATIHRVGNVVFAAENPVLQKGVHTNAFFRQLAAFMQVGKAPDDLHVWLCHVDYLAKALVQISNVKALNNEVHHLEHHFRHTVSGLLTNEKIGLGLVKETDFGEFLDRLLGLTNEPEYATALSELLETFLLTRGEAPQPRGRRMEVITDRTQNLLKRIGFNWPDIPHEGLKRFLINAHEHFTAPHINKTEDKK